MKIIKRMIHGWVDRDMEFLFECSTLHLTTVEHEKRNSISQSNLVLFCLLYKHLTNKMKLLIQLRAENGEHVAIHSLL